MMQPFPVTFMASSGGYHADAVTLDGSTYLDIASFTSTDNVYLSWVFWFKTSVANSPILWVSDPSNFLQYGGMDNAGFVVNRWTAYANQGQGFYYFVQTGEGNANGVWHSGVLSMTVNADPSLRRAKWYIDRIDVTDTPVNDPQDTSGWALNGKELVLFADTFGDNFTGDIADFRFMPGVNLLDGGGSIPSATLDLFITADNKPVDPSVATAALGTTGAVLLSGDASSFATNQGTGGSFALTGTLTNASTSPSD